MRRFRSKLEAAGRFRKTGAVRKLLVVLLPVLAFAPTPAKASIFEGETLDAVADVLTWIVLIVAPVIGIVVFLLIHILPEKIAEKKHHPQAKAIQCLCILSLLFGGMLWPLAWLWAYTKPVLHQMAYGTDKAVPEHVATAKPGPDKTTEPRTKPATGSADDKGNI